jgi:hypothetical protein
MKKLIGEIVLTTSSGVILTLAINLAACGHRYVAGFLAGFVPALIVAAARCGRD